MFKLTLILRYLRRKLAPLFAMLAVALCTAMVIVVISVMGGFLDMMRSAVRTLSGDITISGDLTGFAGYEDLIARLKKLPSVAAATPVIHSYGLLDMDGYVARVEVEGIDPQGLEEVTGFRRTLLWSSDSILTQLTSGMPATATLSPEQKKYIDDVKKDVEKMDLVSAAMSMTPPAGWGDLPAIVPGIEVCPGNRRDAKGQYSFSNSSVKSDVALTVLRLSQRGQPVEPAIQRFTVVNEFKSGLYDIDASRVYVPFAKLQKMLMMDPYPAVNPDTGEPTGKLNPGRATRVVVRGKQGVPLEQIEQAVSDETRLWLRDNPVTITVMTWQDQHRTFLGAVEKEKGLLTLLFAGISVVAVAMIGVIFYMIVLEKTRDIGVLRALGASRGGIASIFMGYGLAIGILGSLVGLGIATAVVKNLNEIQDFLFYAFGFKMWDPRVYYFDKIPGNLNPVEVTVIIVVAMLASLIGSILPAYLASRLNPVEALRYE